tara:strand:- start:283 stop:483 length:201 start_codon:yes stop_codon:yes gene_type:complete
MCGPRPCSKLWLKDKERRVSIRRAKGLMSKTYAEDYKKTLTFAAVTATAMLFMESAGAIDKAGFCT